MAPWGYRTFEDELACDWLEDLFDSDPNAFFTHCLDLRGLDFLEQLACVGVICTSELTHALCRGPREGLPDAVHVWLSDHSHVDGSRFLPGSIRGMRRVLGPKSEMRQRWEDNESLGAKWLEHAADLLVCLESVWSSLPANDSTSNRRRRL
jgi:hypothetical protein